MKKFILLVAVAVLLSMPTQAKIFGFGIKAGLEIPDISTEDVVGSVKGYTGFHAGLLAQINIPIIGLGIQPEVLYVNRGLKYADDDQRVNNIDVPVNITWGIDLKIVRPFIAVTPFISYRFDDLKVSYQAGDLDLKNFNYGIGLGAGVDLFQHVQVMARYNWGLNNLGNSVVHYKLRNFTLSLAYIF